MWAPAEVNNYYAGAYGGADQNSYYLTPYSDLTIPPTFSPVPPPPPQQHPIPPTQFNEFGQAYHCPTPPGGLQPLQNLPVTDYYQPVVTAPLLTNNYQYELTAPTVSPYIGNGLNGDAFLGQVELQPSVQQLEGRDVSFENSLIINEPEPTYQENLDDYWVESGVSNWLTFGQGAPPVPPEVAVEAPQFQQYQVPPSQPEPLNESFNSSEFLNLDEEDSCSQESQDSVSIGQVPQEASSEEEDDEDDTDDDEEEEEEEEEPPQPQTEAVKTPIKPVELFQPRACPHCPKILPFTSHSLFEKHMKSVHQETHPYNCDQCSSKFAISYQLKAHLQVHDPNRYKGDPQWKCGHCEKAYFVRVSLYAHYKTHHPGKKMEVRSALPEPTATPKKTKKIKVLKRSSTILESTPAPPNMKMKKKKLKFSHEVSKSLKKAKKSLDKQLNTTGIPKNLHMGPKSVTTEPKSPVKYEYVPTPDSRPGHHVCPHCSKVFPVLSSLQMHIMLHTGEKPFPCPHCPDHFRLRQTLTYHILQKHRTNRDVFNILRWNKCRVCGKADFVMFRELHQHRTRVHAEVPYEKTAEKTFGCGVCRKPYFMREDAIVCTLLAHRPDQLQEQMFRFKCPQCPKHLLGYCNQAYLRKHQEEAHRKVFNKPQAPATEDMLPSYRIVKKSAQEIRNNGLPKDTSFDLPLYYDLTPFPPSEDEQHWMAKLILGCLKSGKGMDGVQICTLCGCSVNSRKELGIHLRRFHVSRKLNKQKVKEEEEVPSVVEKTEEKTTNSKVEESEENGLVCKFCGETFAKRRMLQFHEVRVHLNPKKERKSASPSKKLKLEKDKWEVHGTVNIRNRKKMSWLLNYQTVFVTLARLKMTPSPKRRRSSTKQVTRRNSKTLTKTKTDITNYASRNSLKKGVKKTGRPRKHPPNISLQNPPNAVVAKIKPMVERISHSSRPTRRNSRASVFPDESQAAPETNKKGPPPKGPPSSVQKELVKTQGPPSVQVSTTATIKQTQPPQLPVAAVSNVGTPSGNAPAETPIQCSPVTAIKQDFSSALQSIQKLLEPPLNTVVELTKELPPQSTVATPQKLHSPIQSPPAVISKPPPQRSPVTTYRPGPLSRKSPAEVLKQASPPQQSVTVVTNQAPTPKTYPAAPSKLKFPPIPPTPEKVTPKLVIPSPEKLLKLTNVVLPHGAVVPPKPPTVTPSTVKEETPQFNDQKTETQDSQRKVNPEGPKVTVPLAIPKIVFRR